MTLLTIAHRPAKLFGVHKLVDHNSSFCYTIET